jgi:acyl-coenzyme A thioesterase PaaI-like protein
MDRVKRLQSAEEILAALVRRRDDANLQAPFDIDEMDLATTRLTVRGRADRSVREGGIVPGPVQMAMADCFGWILSVAPLPPGSDALTVDMTVHFLRPLPVGGYWAECDLLSSSRRRSVVSMGLSPGPDEPVCSAVTMTFAPRSARDPVPLPSRP